MTVATSTNFHVVFAHGNPRLRDSYADALRLPGFLVTTTTDGLACLTLLRGMTPDVLIVDRDLPWGGGDGVLARLRDDPGLPHIPTVILLADPDRVDPSLTPLPNMQCCDNLLPPHQLARKVHQLMDAVLPMEDCMVTVP